MIRKLLLTFAVAIVTIPIALPAAAGSLEDDLADVRARIASLRGEVTGEQSARTPVVEAVLAAQEALDAAELAMSVTKSRYDEAVVAEVDTSARLEAIQSELAIRFAALTALRVEVADTRAEAEAWAIEAYTRGGMAEPAIAFSAPALADIAVGVAYLDVLTGYTSDIADRYQLVVDAEAAEEQKVKEAEAIVAAELAALERTKADLVDLIEQIETERVALELAAAEQEARLFEIDEQIEHFENEISALAREEASIKAAISAASKPAPNPAPSSPGALIRPVPGAVSSGFGKRVHPISGTVKMHNGVDMNARHGDPIRAADDGVVILSGVKGGYGNTVMIDHGGGMVTLYAHQSKLGVSVGDRVSRGEVIGWIGSTGQSTGPHLHFEVRINGVPKDPVPYW